MAMSCSCNLGTFFIFMSACSFSAMGRQLPLLPSAKGVNWKQFEAALAEENVADKDSVALSMLQKAAEKVQLEGIARENRRTDAPVEDISGIPVDDLQDAFASEDEAELAAAPSLSLVQTDASIERVSITPSHELMSGAVQADGTFEMNPQKMATPSNGLMQFSVDGQGGFHTEEGLSLVQTDAHIESKSASALDAPAAPADGTLKIRKTSVPSDVDGSGFVSLMQTDSRIERSQTSPHTAAVVGAVQADGSIEMNPKKAAVPSDGMMHFSVDGSGNFNEEEGFSLIQKDVHVEGGGVIAHPAWSAEAISGVDAVSLIQTDAHIERKGVLSTRASAVLADGSLEMDPHKRAVPTVGMVQMSMDDQGAFHMEI